ncbi:MAG: DUF4910 domain-containing protein [Acidimicrobiia bacterium]
MSDEASVRADIGVEAFGLIEQLYPMCRSITGDGVRLTLAAVRQLIPLEVTEVPSGTSVLDWTVPPEWNIRDAFVADETGHRVIDFRAHNLHVVNYSAPVDTWLTLDELRPHLHTLPDQPDLIPYRTSYYDRNWGFCLSQNALDALTPGRYHVCIDSTLDDGSLTYGQLVITGEIDEEVLVSAHVCHPSLADDNLSGVAVAAMLARDLMDGPKPYRSIRFLFAPGTIGAITWLASHRGITEKVTAGLTVTCLGDDHPFTFKRTVFGGTPIDRAAAHVLASNRSGHEIIDFFPYGYDERQYNSPGFRMPVGSLMRGRHGRFPEYHTSADDLGFVRPERLAESHAVLRDIVTIVADDRNMVNLQPYGEPQLGSRGLYRALGGHNIADTQMAMLWVLNLSDGRHSLLDIAERSGLAFASIASTAKVLAEHGLLAQA